MNPTLLYVFAAPLLVLVGIAVSPVAVAVTLLIRRKLLMVGHIKMPGTADSAVIATLSSVLMVLPWVYVTARMVNRPIHRYIVYSAYLLLYVRWALSPIALGPLVGIAGMFGWGLDYPFASSLFILLVTGPLTFINFAILAGSVNALIRKHLEIPRPAESLALALPHSAYLRPIVYWVVLDMITLFGGVFTFVFSVTVIGSTSR